MTDNKDMQALFKREFKNRYHTFALKSDFDPMYFIKEDEDGETIRTSGSGPQCAASNMGEVEMPKYYGGSCELCHAIFANLSRWQMIKMWLKHKHLLDALLHSNASFYMQTDEVDLQDIFS